MTTTMPAKRKSGWDESKPPSWAQFVAWAVIGPLAIAGFLAAFTPLIVITGPLTVLLILAVSHRSGFNVSMVGAVSGLGVGPIVVSVVILIRGSGPAVPWLLLGAVLVGLGVTLYVVLTEPKR